MNCHDGGTAANCHDAGPAAPGREAWLLRGAELARRLEETKWALGDWATAAAWGDLADVADEVGIAYGTLRNLASISAQFPAARRRERLTWSHHAEAAPLPVEAGDRLLALAEAEGWSVRRLREAAVDWRLQAGASKLREENALLREELSRRPDGRAWAREARRVERECRRRLLAAEAELRSALEAIAALVEHPGRERAHGNSRRGVIERLRAILSPYADYLAAEAEPLFARMHAPAV